MVLITLKYIESSTEETGDFIRKITNVIEHMAGEQIKLPRIQDTSYEAGRMTCANQLRYGLRKDLNDLLQDYLEWKRSEDADTAEWELQTSLMCDEIDGLELYYGKPLKEVYQEEIINKGYDCPEYRNIFVGQSMTRRPLFVVREKTLVIAYNVEFTWASYIYRDN